MSATYALLADMVLLAHLAFVVFAVFGGFLALLWRRCIFVHLPTACWAVLVEWMGWQCPLTPLEQQLRHLAGANGYSGDFIAHYLLPVIYPANLTRSMQLLLGAVAMAINVAAYASLWYQHRHRRSRTAAR